VSRVLALAAAIALAFAASARAEWTLVEERFYTLALAGNPCGRSTERIEKDGDRVRSTSRIEMRFARLGQETTIDLTSEFIENARGEAIEATVAQKGAAPVRYVFETQRKVRIERGAVRETRELPDADWLTPQEVSAFVAARSGAKAEEIRFRALDLQSGFVVIEITMRRKGEAERPVLGRPLKLTNYETRSSVQPLRAGGLRPALGHLRRIEADQRLRAARDAGDRDRGFCRRPDRSAERRLPAIHPAFAAIRAHPRRSCPRERSGERRCA